MSRIHKRKDTEINDGVNYTALFDFSFALPNSETVTVPRTGKRPLVGGKRFPSYILPTLAVQIDKSDLDAGRSELYQLFDTEDDQAYAITKTDDDGSNERFLLTTVDALEQIPSSGGTQFAITQVTDGDVRWRSVQNEQISWNITATGQTLVVNNPGDDDAYAVYTFKPTVAKSSDNPYSAHCYVRWNSSDTETAYPVDVTNAGLDTQYLTTDFYSATGDDIRLLVNGVETDFWLSGINTASTKIWANLDFLPKQEATISGALGVGSVTSIDVNEDISNFPDSGALAIDNEVFIYSAKNTSLKRFTIDSRAAHGTTAASHSDGATIWCKQHEIVVTYGASGLSAYVSDDDYKPAFDLDSSTNTSWVYTDFGDDNGKRSRAWGYTNLQNTVKTTANHATNATPHADIGVSATVNSSIGKDVSGFWSLRVGPGMTNANFTNGEKRTSKLSRFAAEVRSSIDGATYTTEYTIPAPSAADSWEAWSQNISLASGSKFLYVWLMGQARENTEHYIEFADLTLTLNSSNTPTTTVGTQSGNYQLNATLINITTGDSFNLPKSMNLNEEIEVDTDQDTVTYKADGSDQYSLLDQFGVRSSIMRLAPGDNTLQFSDDGTQGLTLTIVFKKRTYT